MEEHKLSFLATTFTVNILHHQILNHIFACPGEAQEVAAEVINSPTSLPNNTVDNMLAQKTPIIWT